MLLVGEAVVRPVDAFAVVAQLLNVYPVLASVPCAESESGTLEL